MSCSQESHCLEECFWGHLWRLASLNIVGPNLRKGDAQKRIINLVSKDYLSCLPCIIICLWIRYKETKFQWRASSAPYTLHTHTHTYIMYLKENAEFAIPQCLYTNHSCSCNLGAYTLLAFAHMNANFHMTKLILHLFDLVKAYMISFNCQKYSMCTTYFSL